MNSEYQTPPPPHPDPHKTKIEPSLLKLMNLRNSSGHHCLSDIYNIGTMCSFQTVSWAQVLVFFKRHRTTMNLVKEKFLGRTDHCGPQEIATQPYQAFRPHCLNVFHHLLQVQQAAVL